VSALTIQTRHGPADVVDGAGLSDLVLAGLASSEATATSPSRLQVWARTTTTTTTRGGGRRQNLVVRCSCGADHLHFAPVGATSVIRRAACGLTYLVRCEPGW
jgi:hypothetical protein